MIALSELAKIVSGEIIGDNGISISGLAPVSNASEGDITFGVDESSLRGAAMSKASCVLSQVAIPEYPKTILKVDNMKEAITILYNALLEAKPVAEGKISEKAVISESAKLGKNVSIGANVVIEDNVVIGDNTVIRPNTTIGEGTKIGDRTIIHSNVAIYNNIVIGNRVIIHSCTTIGADGFGFIPKGDKIYKVPQMGTVIIEDNVEIGSNSCVDRATFGNTVVGANTKLDNLIQIAHNVKMGANNLVAAQTGIAGSTTIGNGCMFGGQSGVVDHAKVGNGVLVGAKTGITSDVEDGKKVFGYPHKDSKDAMKLHAIDIMLIKYFEKIKALIRSL